MRSPISDYHRIYRLGDPPDYEPDARASMQAIGERSGRSAEATAYDLLLENEGRAFLYSPLFNYDAGNYDVACEMMLHPNTILGISDGGAHCSLICDAGAPTYLLEHLVRDRKQGPRIALEQAVRMQTRDTAMLYGFEDRGLLRAGLRADLNLIDLERLAIPSPRLLYDLPASGKRLIQSAHGYEVTVVSGRTTFEAGEATGELPGKLLRGGAGSQMVW